MMREQKRIDHTSNDRGAPGSTGVCWSRSQIGSGPPHGGLGQACIVSPALARPAAPAAHPGLLPPDGCLPRSGERQTPFVPLCASANRAGQGADGGAPAYDSGQSRTRSLPPGARRVDDISRRRRPSGGRGGQPTSSAKNANGRGRRDGSRRPRSRGVAASGRWRARSLAVPETSSATVRAPASCCGSRSSLRLRVPWRGLITSSFKRPTAPRGCRIQASVGTDLTRGSSPR